MSGLFILLALRRRVWLFCILLGFGVAPAHGQQAARSPGLSWRAPAQAARRDNPVAGDQTALARGKEIYARECMVCHGATGKGNGPKAAELRVNPGDFSNPVIRQQSDGALFWKISRGRTPMPGYAAQLSEKDRWMVVHYVRSLSSEGRRAAPTESAESKEEKPPTRTTQAPESQPEKATREGEGGPYVSRAEYDKLKAEHDKLVQEFNAWRKAGGAPPPAPERGPNQPRDPDQPRDVDQPREPAGAEPKELEEEPQKSFFGAPFVLTGSAAAGFTSKRHGDSSFSANFAPLFLWKLSDTLLFESELDVTLKGNASEFDLVRAQLFYLINDYLSFGAGKFLSPMNFLEDRLHQVGKLPDRPLAIQQLLPQSQVGLQLRGATPIGPTTVGYAFYVANAPAVNRQDAANLGRLEFDNFDNLDGYVALGGRLGFYPIPQLELGYGFQTSGLGAVGQDAGALLHSVDLSYVRDSPWLKGTVNLLAQWAWSDVDRITFDREGSLGIGPVRFGSRGHGGYVQLAYRPTMVQTLVLNRLEPVVRYERFSEKRAADFNEERWTIGLNYWLMPNAVFKAAYQFDDKSEGRDQNAFLVQFKFGL